MGYPILSGETFAEDTKRTLDPRASIQSLEYVTPSPAQESTIQLFESADSPGDQKWRFEVRDWLVFICIVTLAMMDAFDATVLIPVLPVGHG